MEEKQKLVSEKPGPAQEGKTDQKPKSSKKKILLGVLILLILAGIAAAAFVLRDKPEETPAQTDESTTSSESDVEQIPEIDTSIQPLELTEKLTSSKLEASISYPQGWQTQESSNDASTYHSLDIGTQVQEGFGIAPGAVGLNLAKFEIGHYMGDIDGAKHYVDQNTGIEYFARADSGLLPEQIFVNYKKEERLISGKTAIRFVRVSGDGIKHTSWFVKVATGIYGIRLFNVGDETDETTLETLENMLQTLHLDLH